MEFVVETDREDDGRWIAELAKFHAVLAYGTSRQDAVARAKALAVRVLVDHSGTWRQRRDRELKMSTLRQNYALQLTSAKFKEIIAVRRM
jgi:hypothetical protein